MKKYSRFIALALCLMLLSGCGAEKPLPAAPAPGGAEVEVTATQDTGLRLLQLMCGEESVGAYSEEDAQPLAHAVWQSISLGDASRAEFPALAAELDRHTVLKHTTGMENFEQMTSDARDAWEWSGEMFAYTDFFSEGACLIHRADERVLSISELCADFLGGAHPCSFWTALNYDPVTAEELTLAQVIPEREGLSTCIIEHILRQTDGAYTREELETIFANKCYPDALTWTLDYDHIEFYFSDYELGSYAQGAWRIAVPFSALEGMIDPYYTEVPASYAVPMNELHTSYIYTGLGGEGVMHKVSVDLRSSDAWQEDGFSCFDTLCVSVDGVECLLPAQTIYEAESYFLRAPDGAYYIYAVCISEGYARTHVFRLDAAMDHRAEYVGEISLVPAHLWADREHYDGAFEMEWNDALYMTVQITDPAAMLLEAAAQPLDSGSAEKRYAVGSDGMPVAKQGSVAASADGADEVAQAFAEASARDVAAVFRSPSAQLREKATDSGVHEEYGDPFVLLALHDGTRVRIDSGEPIFDEDYALDGWSADATLYEGTLHAGELLLVELNVAEGIPNRCISVAANEDDAPLAALWPAQYDGRGEGGREYLRAEEW